MRLAHGVEKYNHVKLGKVIKENKSVDKTHFFSSNLILLLLQGQDPISPNKDLPLGVYTQRVFTPPVAATSSSIFKSSFLPSYLAHLDSELNDPGLYIKLSKYRTPPCK